MKRFLTAAAVAIAAQVPVGAVAQSEPYVGQVTFFPHNFCPRGWSEADGKLLEIASNSALFSLLGTNFGGDGRATFGLPDLRPNGDDYGNWRYCIAMVGLYPSRS